MSERNNPGKRRAEVQALRKDQVIGKYGRLLGEVFVGYVNDPNEVTRRDFATLIADRLRTESTTLRVGALMALMSAFELVLEDRVNFVMDETRQSRLDSMRIK